MGAAWLCARVMGGHLIKSTNFVEVKVHGCAGKLRVLRHTVLGSEAMFVLAWGGSRKHLNIAQGPL